MNLRSSGYLLKPISNADVGTEELLIVNYNSYALDYNKFTSDARQYRDGDIAAINRYYGEYMNQYSWAEGSFKI